MTKKQITAVKKTKKQWTWLKANPDKTKRDYFQNIDLEWLKWPMHECYLCEEWNKNNNACFVHIFADEWIQSTRFNKNGCPLATRTLHCNDAKNNPFDKWCEVKKTEEQNKLKE